MIIKNIDGLLFYCRKNKDDPSYMDLTCHFATTTVHWSDFEYYLINEDEEIDSSYDLIRVDSAKVRVKLGYAIMEGWIPVSMMDQKDRYMHLFDGWEWKWIEYKDIESIEVIEVTEG